MSNSQIKIEKNAVVGGWTLDAPLGSGGNGDVWRVCKQGSPAHAMKFLRKTSNESYPRFRAEIDVLSRLGKLEGIVPLIEKHLPASPKSAPPPWFLMPLATPFAYKKEKPPADVVREFLELARVLKVLHEKNISHRDIKPANFLYLDGRLCLSDFGLVKYPERDEGLTPTLRDVGAKFTMAPEMRRWAAEADGKPADVYSFAKSLWIALTGEDLGFDGQYHVDSVLALRNFLPGIYTTTIDQLITESTDSDPNRRPTMDGVISRLEEWLFLSENFHERNLLEWHEVTQKLFPMGAPAQAAWRKMDEICAVIGEIAKIRALSHMFYPTGGGNTITGVGKAAEPGMIELRIGAKVAEILKPAKLTYESFGDDTRWSYFRLEAEHITPTGIPHAVDSKGEAESLVEITPGEYIPYAHWDEQTYKGAPLPSTSRPITRFLKGSFVFFSTRSVYNRVGSTYDARHNKVSEDKFREYIKRSAELSAQKEQSINDGTSAATATP